MQYLREGTSTVVQLGPFLDKDDALTEETALVLAVEVSGNGSPFTARNSTATITHDTEGWYRIPLSAVDTQVPGRLVIRAQDPVTHLPVWKEFFVVSCDYYDTVFEAGGCTECTTEDCIWEWVACGAALTGCTQYIIDLNNLCGGTWTYGFGANVSATATIEFGDTEFDDVNNGTITLIDTASTSKTYTIRNDYGASAATEFNAGGSRGAAAENFAQIVEGANGHNGTIQAADSAGVRFTAGGYDFSDGVVVLKQTTVGVEGDTAITYGASFENVLEAGYATTFANGSAHKTTAALDWNASCDEVVTAIEGLSNVSSSCITSCTKNGESTWLFCTACDLSTGVVTDVDLVACDTAYYGPELVTQTVPGGDAVPLSGGTPASPVTILEKPFGAHSATGKTAEANELGADRRMVIDYDRDMKNLSDAALKTKIETIDQLFVDHNGEFVITFISSFARDTDVNKYTLPTGADLTAYLELVTNIVKRYSAHNGWGDGSYKSGAFAAPSSAAQTAITARPVKAWQAENEWEWQIFTSTAYTTNVSVATVGGHLSSMHATITAADDSTPGSKVIIAARPSQAAVATATNAAGALVAAGVDGSIAANRVGRFADSDGTTSDVIITGDTDCTFAHKLTSALNSSELSAATTSRDATANLLLNYNQYYDIVDIHSYGAAHSTPTGATGPSDESSPHRVAKHTADWITAIFDDPYTLYPANFTATDKITGKEFWSLESAAPFFFFPMMPGSDQPSTCTSDSDFAYSASIHSMYVPKLYAQNLAAGIKRTFYSALTPDTTRNNNYQRLALTDTTDRFGAGSLGKKPAYYTYKVMSEKLSSINKVEEIPLNYGTGHVSAGQSAASEATVIKCSIPSTTAANATLTFGATEFDDVNNGTLTLIDAVGTSKTYTIRNDYGASAATEFNAGGSRGAAAENLAQVVESVNGHNGTIYATDSSDVRFSTGGYDFSDGVVKFKQETIGVAGNTTITTAANFDNCTVVNIGSAFAGGAQLDPIYIAWSQNATVKSLDLSTELGPGAVTVTHVITEIDDDIPDVTTADTNSIALTAYPVFLQTSSGELGSCDYWELSTPCPGDCVCDVPAAAGTVDGQLSTVDCHALDEDSGICPAVPTHDPALGTWSLLCNAIASLDSGAQEVTFTVSFMQAGVKVRTCTPGDACPDCPEVETVTIQDYGTAAAGPSTVGHDQFVSEVLDAFGEWKTLFETVFPGLTVNIVNLGDESDDHQDFSNCESDTLANGYAVGTSTRIGDFRIGMIPFTDGAGGTLARAYPPPSNDTSPWRVHSNGSCASCGSFHGDIHFDKNENWRPDQSDESNGYSIKWVAAHEIGHAFGLAHDSNNQSLMYPSAGFNYSFGLRLPSGLANSLAEKCAVDAAYDGCGSADPNPPPNESSDDADASSEPSETIPEHPSQVCEATPGTSGSRVQRNDLTIANQITRGTGHWGYLECADSASGYEGITALSKPGYKEKAIDPVFRSAIMRITPDQVCHGGANRPCGTSHSGQGQRVWFLYSGTTMNGQNYRVADRVTMYYPVAHAWNVDGTLLQFRDTNVPFTGAKHPWDSSYNPSQAHSKTERFMIYDGGAHVYNGAPSNQRSSNSGYALVRTGALTGTRDRTNQHEATSATYSPLMTVNVSGTNNFWSLNPDTRQDAYSVTQNGNLITRYKNKQNAGKASAADKTTTGRQFLREFTVPFFTMLTSKMTAVFPARYKNATDGLTFKHATRKDKTITAANTSSPIQITSTGHDLTTGQTVVITGVGGQTAANGTFTITKVDANNFTLDGTTSAGSYTSGGTWYQQVTVAENTYVAVMGNKWANYDSSIDLITELNSTTNPDGATVTQNGGAIEGVEPWLYVINLDYDADGTDQIGPVVAAINLADNPGWAKRPGNATGPLGSAGEQYMVNANGTRTSSGTKYIVGADTNSVRCSADGRYVAIRYADGYPRAFAQDSWRFFEIDLLAYTTDPGDLGMTGTGSIKGTQFNITSVDMTPVNSATVSYAHDNAKPVTANGSLAHGHNPFNYLTHPAFVRSKVTTAQAHFGDTIQKPYEYFVGGASTSTFNHLKSSHGYTLSEYGEILGEEYATDAQVDNWSTVVPDNPCGWIGRVLATNLTVISSNKCAAVGSGITAATNAAPIAITTAGNHGLSNGDVIIISEVSGNTAANGTFTITKTSDTAFTLNGSTGTGTGTGGIWVESATTIKSLDHTGAHRDFRKTEGYSAYPSYFAAPLDTHPTSVAASGDAAYVYVSYSSKEPRLHLNSAGEIVDNPDLTIISNNAYRTRDNGSRYRVGTGDGELFRGEIVAFNIDNPNLGMLRICHHRAPTNAIYETLPWAQVSPDGTKLLFSSSWSGLGTPPSTSSNKSFPACSGNSGATSKPERWEGQERTESFIIDLVTAGVIANPTSSAGNSLTGGSVTALTLTAGGSGFTTAPKVTVGASPGRRAKAAAITYNGSVVALSVLDGGSGYTEVPDITISGGGGAGATATAAIDGPGCTEHGHSVAKWIFQKSANVDAHTTDPGTSDIGQWVLECPCCSVSGVQGAAASPVEDGQVAWPERQRPQTEYTACSDPNIGTISPTSGVTSGEVVSTGGSVAGGVVTISPTSGVPSGEDVPTGGSVFEPSNCPDDGAMGVTGGGCGCAEFTWVSGVYTSTSNNCTGGCNPPNPTGWTFHTTVIEVSCG